MTGVEGYIFSVCRDFPIQEHGIKSARASKARADGSKHVSGILRTEIQELQVETLPVILLYEVYFSGNSGCASEPPFSKL